MVETESGCPMNDKQLINRIRRGDEAAAEELVHRYHPSILRFCKSRCGDMEMAKDLAQETFIQLFEALPNYREEGRLKAYIFTIARRLCSKESNKPTLATLDDTEQLVDERNMFHQIEDRDEIHRLLEKLPPGQREVIVLRFIERLSYRDIAKVTGCNMRTVQSRVRLALKNMRKESGHE